MAVSFKYWNDCVDELDLKAMWMVPDVGAEWLDAGETTDQKVHLSRDPDGQAYLTQTEMRVNSSYKASLRISRSPYLVCRSLPLYMMP